MSTFKITAMLFLLSVSAYGQQLKSRLNFTSGKITQGSSVSLSYDAKGSDLEYSDAVKAAVYVFDNESWRVDTLNLKGMNGTWNAAYAIPGDARFVAFKFYQGPLDNPEATDDNNLKGFYAAVRDKTGKSIPGNAVGEAQLFQPMQAANNIYGYFGKDLDDQLNRADQLLEQEKKIKGSSIADYLFFYLNIKKKVLGEAKAKVVGTQVIKTLLEKPGTGEQQLAKLSRLAAYNLKDEQLADDIANRILRNYPGGSEARFVAFSRIKKNSPDAKVREASYEEFLKAYPVSEWRKKRDGKGFMYYELYRNLGSSYFESRQYDKFVELFKQMDFRSGNEVWRWNLTRGQMLDELKKGNAADTLLSLAEATIPYLLKLKDDGSYSEDFNSAEAARSNAYKQLDDRLFTLIFLQNKTRNYKRAAESFKHLSEEGRYSNADLNEIHLNVLENLGDTKSILPLLEMSAKANALTPRMITKLKEIYLAANNQDASVYEQYFNSLRSGEENRELVAHVKEGLVNFPYKSFELEDADGKIVKSADWKDKIVIIDFWATWCRPCIMAFPGMQLVVDKYAKDPDVLVYFIGTMQNGDYKTKSVNYVRESGFRFNLLHDAVNSTNGEQNVVFRSMVPLFKSSAIPRKIIVQNGIIKYTSEGYSGSPSKLLDELSIAVDLIKNQK